MTKELITILFLSATLGMASCTSEVSLPDKDNRLVQVEPVIAGYYPSVAVSTRADVDNTTLAGRSIYPLEDGSTIRLVVYNESKELLAAYSKSYVVRNSTASGSLLYPCEVDDNGVLISETSTPLFLSAGTYYFRILSPAKALDNGFVKVGNGEYLMATDDRYEQTKMVSQTINKVTSSGDINPIQTLQLQPIIHQTARMKFTIKAGEGVHTLQMLSEGIEIGGLQKPVDGSTSFDWVNGEVLPVNVGDQSSSVHATHSVRNADNSMTVDTGVLPTDARSHSISVLLNLSVNGNPTQYQMLLTDLLLQAGYSYNYTATVKINNGVTVLTWQSRSWTETVEIGN